MVRTEEFALNRFGGDPDEGRRGLRRGRASRWSPRTSPTVSRCAPPARTTSTSTAWWSARSPRPPSTRCTASWWTLAEAGRRGHPGHHQPQPAAPGRQLDRVPAAALLGARRRTRWWSIWVTAPTPVTARRAAGRLAARSARTSRWSAWRSTGTGRRRAAGRRSAAAGVPRAAVSNWPACGRWWCGRSTCCGSTTSPRWRRPGAAMTGAPGGARRGHLRRAGPARHLGVRRRRAGRGR